MRAATRSEHRAGPENMPRKPTRHNLGEGRRRRRRDERRILRFRRGMWWQHAWDRFNVQQGKSAEVPQRGNAQPVRARGGPADDGWARTTGEAS